MRRLTLILSDLYLPADAGQAAVADMLALPSLEWLLRFAEVSPGVDWRRWLARELGAGSGADADLAGTAAAGLGAEPQGAWLATPVHLEARLDHVRLRDRGVLRLPPAQRERLQAEFATSFGPGIVLHDIGEQGFLLEGGPRIDARTTDPARWLDADVGPALPSAQSAGELRRLTAELEMWLHASAVNTERERAGQRRITSLWLWGGGAGQATPLPSTSVPLYGSDFWLRALGRESVRAPPLDFTALPAGDAVLQFAPMSGSTAEQLSTLESAWFSPIRAALSSRNPATLRLLANDRVFTTGPRAGWRFWRKRSGWLHSLSKA